MQFSYILCTDSYISFSYWKTLGRTIIVTTRHVTRYLVYLFIDAVVYSRIKCMRVNRHIIKMQQLQYSTTSNQRHALYLQTESASPLAHYPSLTNRFTFNCVPSPSVPPGLTCIRKA
jgi:hypothetical protein